MKKFTIFKTPKKNMFKLWHHLKPKKKKQNKNNLRRRLHWKKKVVKVEKGEMDGNEENRKIGKICGSFNCAFHGETELKFVKNVTKQGKILVFTMCL